MKQILANYTASISEFKKNPSVLISNAYSAPIAVLNQNTPTAYLVPAQTHEYIMDDIDLRGVVTQRLGQIDKAVKVKLENL